MAESKDVWLCVNQLAKALSAKGPMLDEQTASALEDFAKLPRETQQQLLKRLSEVAVASAAMVAAATSQMALNNATAPADL